MKLDWKGREWKRDKSTHKQGSEGENEMVGGMKQSESRERKKNLVMKRDGSACGRVCVRE